MTEKIILLIISIIMLVITLKKGDKLTIFLTTGLTIGILITLTKIPILLFIGSIIYMLTALGITIISIKRKDLTKLNQVTILLSGIWAFVGNLSSIMHWPHAEIFHLSMIIPILFFVISLFYGMFKRKEFGYLSIMNLEFAFHLFR